MNGNKRAGQPLPRLPTLEGAAEALGVYGTPRPIYLLGGSNHRGHHRVVHHRLLPGWIHHRADHRCCLCLFRCGTYPYQTTERAPYQEIRPRRVHLRLFQEDMRKYNIAHFRPQQGQQA